ncbi:C40 family peptidase [Lacticaseibacillus daqingensis]|uniref:C40 family peptidase n=1 Tax=Lacticaseibacillus daqingensis TaxID=2486014 RepID=UPI000F7A8293|nr:NlpC/P60 family protein [Lacticaseibacillus daqingensis]
MKHTLTAPLLVSAAVLTGLALSDSQPVAASSSLTIKYSANLRQAPSTSAKIIGGLTAGAHYTYSRTAQANGYTWYEIGTNRWVASAGAQATDDTATASGTLKVLAASNRRTGPGTGYGISGSFTPGQVLSYTATAQANGYTWYQVAANAWVASAGTTVITGGSSTPTPGGSGTPASGHVTVTASSNKRVGPGTGYAISGSFTRGQVLAYTATASANGYTWYQVGANAWIASAGATVSTGESTDTETPGTGETAASGKIQITATANQRAGAGTSYRIIGNVRAGAIYAYTATAQADGYTWYKIGANAWVASAGAAIYTGGDTSTETPGGSTSTAGTVAAVIALAKQQLGKPYVWGGKGPDSFDCSGLMAYLFSHAAGKNIGGYTLPQESAGTRVSLSNLQPGDIVFWGNSGSTYHNALYIGNNQYIHAPKPGDVVKVATIANGFMPSFGVRVL